VNKRIPFLAGRMVRSFANCIHWIGGKGTVLSVGSLVGIMLLVVANIIARFFGTVIIGTIELVELMIVVTVAFALGYTAQRQSHVVVKVVVSRFSPRAQAILKVFTTALSIGVCAVIVWASAGIMYERALLGEETELLSVPSFPFRFIWVFGLILFCFVLLIDLCNAISGAARK
jgi:TRAP-type C4-dicarboxylate transport system permease small subunit